MSKQPPPAPTASAVGPCPTVIQIVGRPGTGSLPSTIAPPDHPLNHERKAFQNYLLSLHPFGLKHCGCHKSAGNVFSHKILSQNYLCQATTNLFNFILNLLKKFIKII